MSTIGRTGDPLEGTFIVPTTYPDPQTQDVNTLPFGFAYGEGNYMLDPTAPSQPGPGALDSKTATSITFHWSASTDNVAVDHYNIYSGTSKIGQTANTNATISGLTTATAYSLSVTAVDKHGNESIKNTALAVTTS